MAIRKIVKKGDPILTKKCRPVTDFDEKLAALLDDMVETLVDANGLGLAGPQVGILRRLCIIVNNDGEYIELVNPEVMAKSQETCGVYEGCLSVPGLRGWVERPVNVIVKAFDRNGNPFTLKLEEMAARAALHEIDHLDGHLFLELSKEIVRDDSLT